MSLKSWKSESYFIKCTFKGLQVQKSSDDDFCTCFMIILELFGTKIIDIVQVIKKEEVFFLIFFWLICLRTSHFAMTYIKSRNEG